MKPIIVRGRPLAGGALPAVCVPLVARTGAALRLEVQAAAALQPDLLEWRVDFFDRLGDVAACLAAASTLRAEAGHIPLLLTRRSPREGGQPATVTESQVVELYRAACEAGFVDLVDWEMASDPSDVAAVREAARRHGVGVLLSFHDFHRTPAAADLFKRYRQAAEAGADVAKVAVMPADPGDVLALLQATWEASRALDIPVAGMAMGPVGAVSRLCAGAFGSALTFAVGQAASAPGQMPLARLRTALDVLRAAAAPGR